MTWKTRRIVTRFIILIIMFSLIGYRFGGEIYNRVIHQPICEKTVTEAGILSVVKSIKYTTPTSNSEKPYTLVMGYDDSGNEKAAWLNFEDHRFKPTIYHKVDLNQSISRSEAISIVKDNELLAHIPKISIAYVKNSTSTLEKGHYWSISNSQGKLVYVNMDNGKYSLQDHKKNQAR